jgi:flap endonuclease-1
MHEIKSYFGRKIAIDASMSLYQFLIAIRQDGSQLANADGEVTRYKTIPNFIYSLTEFEFSHLNGMFYRTIRMMENGIKPIYVRINAIYRKMRISTTVFLLIDGPSRPLRPKK